MHTVSFSHYAKSARLKYHMGKHKEAIADYKEAINLLTFRIQQAMDNEQRNRFVRCLNTLQAEMHTIQQELLPSIQQVCNVFNENLDQDSDSPPTDPPGASPQSIFRKQPANGRQSMSISYHNKRMPASTKPASKTRSTRTTSTTSSHDKTIAFGSSTGSTTAIQQRGTINRNTRAAGTSNENVSTVGMDISTVGSLPDSVDRPFDFAGYDKELVSLIQNGILQQTPQVQWNDISGLEAAKMLLLEAVVLPKENPELFQGIRRPWRGICMFGPPGTGKTMLAKAVAHECGTTFFNVSSATLTAKYRGDSEKLVRLLFEIAHHRAPSTIFIDEIDSIGSKRGSDSEHEASRRVKAELLIQMDGCASDDGKTVLVLGATNFPWDMDDALRRRLEKRIYIPLPDREARRVLLTNALREVELDADVNLDEIADRLGGYSGSDITGICRDAAMAPMREQLRAANVFGGMEARRAALQQSDLIIRKCHFDIAMQNIMPTVSQSEVRKYVQWMEEFGSK